LGRRALSAHEVLYRRPGSLEHQIAIPEACAFVETGDRQIPNHFAVLCQNGAKNSRAPSIVAYIDSNLWDTGAEAAKLCSGLRLAPLIAVLWHGGPWFLDGVG